MPKKIHTMIYANDLRVPINPVHPAGLAWKPIVKDGTFAVTTKAYDYRYVYKLSSFTMSPYGGWNGFDPYTPPLTPMVSALGVQKLVGTAGDSGQWFCGWQWKKGQSTGSGSNLPREYAPAASFLKSSMETYEMMPLGYFVLDCIDSLKNFYASGLGVPLGIDDRFGHSTKAVTGLQAVNVPKMFVGVQVVDGVAHDKSKELVRFLWQSFGSATKFVVVGNASIAEMETIIPKNNIIHGFYVATDGKYERVGGGVIPAMTPAEFHADVIKGDYADVEVMAIAQNDSIQVAQALIGMGV